MPFEEQLTELETRRARALAMGGPEKLARRQAQGVLNARSRIDALFDVGSFIESGMFAASARADDRAVTPADGKVAGFGRVDGREVAVVSNDFTVKGASSATINIKKLRHMKRVAKQRGIPIVFLGESTGARMPDIMGAASIGSKDDPVEYQRTREAPWVAAVLGHSYGSSAWYAAMSDFCVMRKGAIMAVSSPRLIAMATGRTVDAETLGGWRVHAEASGIVDQVVDSDEEALAAIRRFLSYLPSNHMQAPPEYPVPPGSDDAIKGVMGLLPESPNQVYDVRAIVRAIFDRDSMFEMKARFGRTVVTALARLDGRSIGVVANNPLHKGGAIDADACRKVQSFLVLCDSFNIPLVFLVDQPGFLIGMEGEQQGVTGKVMNWMNALTLCTVPKLSVVMRKSYGLAVSNMGGGGNADEVACWVSAEVSFMKPEFGAQIVHGVTPDEPEKFREATALMAKGSTPYDMAAVYTAHNVIDPRDTRGYLKRMLEVHRMRLSDGVGRHLMCGWPTSY
ncbi:MAG TPA: carboxyl transferase domain-containing protein [Burkholderiales bacterium]|jgi:acetyl-CoA carboxylase carboxyltransferase component|nr:carboxyl transferase domain-containing protein [Burkholderiales bacterium]